MSRLQQRIVAEFIAWASAGDAGLRDRVTVLLRDRPDPTRWRSGDVHALFMDSVAARQVDAWQLRERGLDTVRDYLRFLDETGRLHPASARPAALLKELDRLTAKFPAAMAETTGDQVSIVPPTRPAPDRPVSTGDAALATNDAGLAKAVSTGGAAVLRDLDVLAGWVGIDGRAVDDRGELRKADRPALLTALGLPDDKDSFASVLRTLWQQAIEFDVVQLRRGRVVRGPGADLVARVLAGTATAREALELWSGIADVLIHPVTPLHAEKGTEFLRGWLDPWTPLFLDLLAATGGGPADLAALIDRLLEQESDRIPGGDPELFTGVAGTAIRNILAHLDRHGAVTVAGFGDDPARAAAAAAFGTSAWAMWPQPGVTVELTDLGRHLMSVRSAPAGP
jgi:hypothetical protein